MALPAVDVSTLRFSCPHRFMAPRKVEEYHAISFYALLDQLLPFLQL